MICKADANSSDIEAAVAIVGSGPAGLSLALTLAQAGIDTVVIESGVEQEDACATALSSAAAIAPENHPPVELTTNRRLGGTSWIWGGRCVDFDPIDFVPRPNAEVPGWPITYQDATAEAAGAAMFLGIGEPNFETPLACGGSESALHARLDRWCADPRLARRHAAEIRVSSKVRVYLGLTCIGVAFDPGGGPVRGLRVRHRSGSECRVTARHYVLAAGGIETARLLLASTETISAGTRGAFDWLGRGYMGHAQGVLADVVLQGLSEDAIDYKRDGGACYVRPRLMFTSETLRRNGLLNIAFQPSNPPLGDWRHRSSALSTAALALYTPLLGRALQHGPIREVLLGQALNADDLWHHLVNIISDGAGATGFAAHALRSRLQRPQAPGMFVRNKARRYSLRYYGEQSASHASQILLSRDCDAAGVPRVVVKKSITDVDVWSVLTAHNILDGELRRLGLGRLEFHAAPEARRAVVVESAADGYHQIGLVRMGVSPRSSVVDAHCRLHTVPNLHIAGSSVFPTSGQANPTFLIVCLALRLAKRLIKEMNLG